MTIYPSQPLVEGSDGLLQAGVLDHNTTGWMTCCMDIQLYGYMAVWLYGQWPRLYL